MQRVYDVGRTLRRVLGIRWQQQIVQEKEHHRQTIEHIPRTYELHLLKPFESIKPQRGAWVPLASLRA
eukprot:4078405-Amphidinium_carterae.1